MSKRPGMPSFEEMAFVNGSHGLVNTSWGAIKIGIYHKHIQRWLKYFPRERMHFVDGQRLITHPAIETNLVERFLNLNTFINDKHFYINETKKFPCIIRTSGHGPPRCLGKTKGRQHPHVSEDHLNKLRTFFANHNERFFRIISQRFDWWTWKILSPVFIMFWLFFVLFFLYIIYNVYKFIVVQSTEWYGNI